EAPRASRSTHHGEAREAAEARSREEEATEAPRVPQRHPPARKGTQGVPPAEQPARDEGEQGCSDVPPERGAREAEGAGAHREGASAAPDARGRGRLPKAH
ncbi:UNVERIFIED_CONTAM: hypothetical protein GTU68_037505, partial [Idotea baltica]|nr:hypothetical protein [Idotea baltica]